MTSNAVLCTGGFDPLHSGHMDYFNAAKEFGDRLIVGINSDEWLVRKKGHPFMPIEERMSIIQSLRVVDTVILFDDSDDTACDAIEVSLNLGFPLGEQHEFDTITFVNGGDRTDNNIPEIEKYKDNDRVLFQFGVGGNKKNSSSWILKDWKKKSLIISNTCPKEKRSWGYYRVLHEANNIKVKELTVDPGEKLSMQRHKDRAEYWMVSEGDGTLIRMNNENYNTIKIGLFKHKGITIKSGDWHQLCNFSKRPLRVIEIQYGLRCDEEDIERLK